MADTGVVVATTCPRYESRWALPFVGIMGWIYYVWELFIIIAVMCTITDNWNNAPWLFIGVLITSIVVGFVLWLINAFYFMPYYATRASRYYRSEPGVLPEMIMEREERTYAGKVREDLKAHNDQEHFQGVVFRSAVILIFLGIYIGQNGTQSFQPIPAAPTEVQIMNYVVSKVFQLMILGCAAWSYGRLAETHSDFMWRHMTAENNQYREKNGGENKALGQPNNVGSSGGVMRRTNRGLG